MLLFMADRNKPSSLMVVFEEVFGPDIKSLSDTELNLLGKACIAYILNVLQWPSVFKMLTPINNRIAEISNDTAFNRYKDLRHELIKTTKTSLNLKMFILRLMVKELNGDTVNVKQEAKACGVSKNDTAVWYNLEEIGLKELTSAIINYEGFSVALPSSIAKDAAEFIQTCQSYIESYTRKNLRFIYESNNLQDIDLMGDLRLAAIHAYYQKVPFLTGEHLKNCVRLTISNYGRKIIEHYTHPDRARIYYDKDREVYERKVITDGEFLSMKREKAALANEMESSSMDFYIYAEGLKKVHGKVVNLLMLEDDADFLSMCSSYSADSCEDLFKKTGRSAYYELIAQYTNRPIKQIVAIIDEIKTTMAA